MNKVVLIICILFWKLSFSQIINGQIHYDVKITPIEDNKFDKFVEENSPNAYKMGSQLEFILKFDTIKSSFILIDKLFDDNADKTYAFVKIDFFGNNIVIKDTVYEETVYSEEKLIIKKIKKSNWILTDESKIIDNFLCYKATTENIVINPVGIFKHPITAWYCPEIPFSYGPIGYNGLPGLILELQTRGAVYGATKLTFNNDELKIDELKNYKIMEEEQYEEQLKEIYEEIQK